ncbi:MAG: methionine biosynthesis protein MetW [Desulfosudaceae bacterium]
MRFDHQVIASWIAPGSRVLALGCGEGDLLRLLKQEKQVAETGIEIVESRVLACIEKGLSVLQGDINEELRDYPDGAMDYVILSQTLQEVLDPAGLIAEMLRVGQKAIVSFPNFGHWRLRGQLLFRGQAPVSRDLPYEWYETPNIRVLSIRDFKRFVRKMGMRVEREAAIASAISVVPSRRRGQVVRLLPNLLATYGIFELSRP